MVWPFTVLINYSSDLKNLCKFFSLYQNNFGHKIEFQIYIFFPGVENLRGAGMIAGETSQSYNEVNHGELLATLAKTELLYSKNAGA